MQAMILAAGLGTRLLPHSLIRPKPLFPVLNHPLLLLTIKRLQNIGFDRIMVNCHHLREQIVAALTGLDGVIVLEEKTLLGTGGGLRGALKNMRDEPLLVTNGDIYHTVDLRAFYKYHVSKKNLVTLAMHDYPRFNNVMVRDDTIRSFETGENALQLAFTGIHMINPEVLVEIEENRYSCIIDRYRNLLGEGVGIGCYRADNCFWSDMGTEDDYLNLHQGLLKNYIPCWPEIGSVRKPYCTADKAELPANFECVDWACIGKAVIEEESYLKRVVVWDNVQIAAKSRLVDKIVSGYDEKNKL